MPLKVVFLMRLVVARGAAEIEDPTMAFLAQMSFRSTPEFPGIFMLQLCLLSSSSFLRNQEPSTSRAGKIELSSVVGEVNSQLRSVFEPGNTNIRS